MKTRTLPFALLAIWFGLSSIAAAEPEHQYGGFSPDADGRQAYLDYIHSLEMIAVEAGPQLRSTVEAIPVEADVALTPDQEADLRAWLYDFLVAFSVSGNDSLAAAFYLREGVNNPDRVEQLKKMLEAKGILKGDTPLAIFQAGHRENLDFKGRDYFFGNASFFDSVYRVFEKQGGYESYMEYAKTHGLLPTGLMAWPPKLMSEVVEALQAGEQRVFADIMFIVEEPEEFADFEGPIRTPFFVRQVWDRERSMWRLVEIFTSNNAPVMFSFIAT